MPRRSAKPAPISTVSFVSLGCPKNLVDSEKMLGLLAQDGIVPVADDPAAQGPDRFGGADAVVINTCGFLEASKEESLSVIREAVVAKQQGAVRRVVVAGCLVQRHRARMLEWEPGIDAMVGVFDRDMIVHAVRGGESPVPPTVGVASPEPSAAVLPDAAARKGALDPAASPKYWVAANALAAAKQRGLATVGLTVHGNDGKGIGYFEDDSARLRLTPRHYAYLRISEGCNQNCAFCTIPSIRGKMRSKGPDAVADEARELILDGAFELNLIGQDTTSYGQDIGAGFRPGAPAAPVAGPDLFAGGLPAMLRLVCGTVRATSGAGWVRLMYAYPSNFSDPMIDAFARLAGQGILLPYIDMPLQHASDRMLTAMRRNVAAEHQRRLLRRLRERIPGIAVRTTFISGFPGETEDDHRQLLQFVEESAFENLGVFEYSREDGTVAGTMEKDPALAVPAEVKSRRRGEIMALQQKIVFARNQALAARFDEAAQSGGERVDVLIDEPLRSRGRATAGLGQGGRLYRGRTRAQAPQIDGVTFVQSREKLAPGELIPCAIVGWDGYDLVARPAAELDKKITLKIL